MNWILSLGVGWNNIVGFLTMNQKPPKENRTSEIRNPASPSHCQTKDNGSLLRGSREGGGENWRKTPGTMPGVANTGWRPGDLGQASEHLSPGHPDAGRANAKGWAGGGGWGGTPAPRPGRLPRCTCGSAPPPASPGSGAAAAPAEKPPSQKAASSPPPWRRDDKRLRPVREPPGRGYRHSFETRLARERDPAWFSRGAGPGSRERQGTLRPVPLLDCRCWYACAEGGGPLWRFGVGVAGSGVVAKEPNWRWRSTFDAELVAPV